MIWEILAGAGLLLFALIQVGMMLASYFFYPKVKAWKNSLSNSQSTWAKLELKIFF